MKWYKPTEKLPALNQDVLVCTSKNKVRNEYAVMFVYKDSGASKTWLAIDEITEMGLYDIECWQPIEEPT